MSMFRRLTTTLTTRVDRLVSEIENHDAVVEAGIRDARQALATAQVRCARVQQEGERLASRLAEAEGQARTWRERALASAAEDQALECLRRHRLAAVRAEALRVQRQGHQATAAGLFQAQAQLRERLQGLEQRRALMRGREATATAAGALSTAERAALGSLDEVFERWEERVLAAEYAHQFESAHDDPHGAGADPFEVAFIAAEERATLRAELAALRGERADDAPRNQPGDDHAH